MIGLGIGVGFGGNVKPLALPLALGAKLWLRADLGVTLNAGNVATWADQSASGLDFAQGTAGAQPLFVASDAGFGGQPVVQFLGTNDALTRAAPAWSACHVLWVSKNDDDPPTDPNSGAPVCFGEPASPSNHFPYSDGVVYLGTATTARKTCGNPTTSLATTQRVEVLSKLGGWSLRVGSEAVYSTASNGVGWPANIGLGNSPPDATYWWKGKLAEVIAFDSEISAGNLTLLRAYLDARYGL